MVYCSCARVLPYVPFYLFPLKFSRSVHRLTTGRKVIDADQLIGPKVARLSARSPRPGCAQPTSGHGEAPWRSRRSGWEEINPGSRMRCCRLGITEPAEVMSFVGTARPAELAHSP
jgi:hypothetical protein